MGPGHGPDPNPGLRAQGLGPDLNPGLWAQGRGQIRLLDSAGPAPDSNAGLWAWGRGLDLNSGLSNYYCLMDLLLDL